MSQDEIINEVRAVREAYAKRFGFDVRAIYDDAKERENTTSRRVVSLEPKRMSCSASYVTSPKRK